MFDAFIYGMAGIPIWQQESNKLPLSLYFPLIMDCWEFSANIIGESEACATATEAKRVRFSLISTQWLKDQNKNKGRSSCCSTTPRQ